MKKKYDGIYNWFKANGYESQGLADKLIKHFTELHANHRITNLDLREIFKMIEKDFPIN